MEDRKITLYPCEDGGGWEVIITDIDGEQEPDHEWCTTKSAAIKLGRDVFNADPTIKKIVVLNKEHWEEVNGQLVLANDETVIRERT